MENIVHSSIGLLHFLAACVALVLGTLVLVLSKGTTLHKRIGYGYVVAMLAVNFSAFGLYHLFGKFGIFHYLALVSLAGICIGMLPMFLKKYLKNPLRLHISQMYFSVMGLYCAFVAETGVRLPIVKTWTGFWIVVFGTGALIMIVGVVVYLKKFKSWKRP